jgi:hypothetical protein
VRDKEALNARVSSLLDSAHEAKRQQEAVTGTHKENNGRLQEKVKAASTEIARGNAIIGKLQADTRALKGKLALKNSVLMQQQEHATHQAAEMDAIERAAADMRSQCAELRAGKQRAEEATAALKERLVEAQELLRSNQQVIQWLNKELNDAQTGGPPFLGAPGRVAAFRPTGLAMKGATFASGSPNLCEPIAHGTEKPRVAALSSLRSRAGIAIAGHVAPSGETTSTGGGFADYLSPAAAN